MDHFCYFCLVLLCFHARLFVDALWSPAGKGLTSWLSFVMSYCDVVTFPLGQVWCLIVSIPNRCSLSNCDMQKPVKNNRKNYRKKYDNYLPFKLI